VPGHAPLLEVVDPGLGEVGQGRGPRGRQPRRAPGRGQGAAEQARVGRRRRGGPRPQEEFQVAQATRGRPHLPRVQGRGRARAEVAAAGRAGTGARRGGEQGDGGGAVAAAVEQAQAVLGAPRQGREAPGQAVVGPRGEAARAPAQAGGDGAREEAGQPLGMARPPELLAQVRERRRPQRGLRAGRRRGEGPEVQGRVVREPPGDLPALGREADRGQPDRGEPVQRGQPPQVAGQRLERRRPRVEREDIEVVAVRRSLRRHGRPRRDRAGRRGRASPGSGSTPRSPPATSWRVRSHPCGSPGGSRRRAGS